MDNAYAHWECLRDNSRKDIEIIFPVERIGAISVYVEFEFKWVRTPEETYKYNCSLDIYHKTLKTDSDDYYLLYSEIITKDIVPFEMLRIIYKDSIQIAIMRLKHLRINRFTGCLERPPYTEESLMEISRQLNDFKDLKLTSDKCCICFEYTQTTTVCKHYLCVICAEQIRPNQYNDDYRCPLCRKALLMNSE